MVLFAAVWSENLSIYSWYSVCTSWLKGKQHINYEGCSGHSSHYLGHTAHTSQDTQFTLPGTHSSHCSEHSSHFRQKNVCNSFSPDRYRSSLAPPDRDRWYLEGAEVWAGVGAGVWFLSFCPVESVSKKESLEDGYPTATVGGWLCSKHDSHSCHSWR